MADTPKLKSLDCTVNDGARQREAAYAAAHADVPMRRKYRKPLQFKSIGHTSNGNSGKPRPKATAPQQARPVRRRVLVYRNGRARFEWQAA